MDEHLAQYKGLLLPLDQAALATELAAVRASKTQLEAGKVPEDQPNLNKVDLSTLLTLCNEKYKLVEKQIQLTASRQKRQTQQQQQQLQRIQLQIRQQQQQQQQQQYQQYQPQHVQGAQASMAAMAQQGPIFGQPGQSVLLNLGGAASTTAPADRAPAARVPLYRSRAPRAMTGGPVAKRAKAAPNTAHRQPLAELSEDDEDDEDHDMLPLSEALERQQQLAQQQQAYLLAQQQHTPAAAVRRHSPHRCWINCSLALTAVPRCP